MGGWEAGRGGAGRGGGGEEWGGGGRRKNPPGEDMGLPVAPRWS